MRTSQVHGVLSTLWHDLYNFVSLTVDLHSLQVPVVLVESKPDVRSVHLVPTDEFLVIGCDGVWDVLKNQVCHI